MSKKTIYLVRHGETEFNRRGIVQGSGIDADLNTLGQLQAQAFFEAYRHIPFEKIYTSALKRTHQSVKNFIEQGLPHEAYADLNEISWGNREGKIPNHGDADYYKMLTETWQSGNLDLQADEGESPKDVQVRLRKMIELITSRQDEKLILIACHGRAMRVLLATLFADSLTKMDEFPHTNLGLYELEYDNKTKEFSLVRTNDTAHLQGISFESLNY